MNEYPCSMTVWNEASKRDMLTRAQVNCEYHCGTCGWNPDELARRLREGQFVKNKQGGKRLLFPPKGKGDTHEQT